MLLCTFVGENLFFSSNQAVWISSIHCSAPQTTRQYELPENPSHLPFPFQYISTVAVLYEMDQADVFYHLWLSRPFINCRLFDESVRFSKWAILVSTEFQPQMDWRWIQAAVKRELSWINSFKRLFPKNSNAKIDDWIQYGRFDRTCWRSHIRVAINISKQLYC